MARKPTSTLQQGRKQKRGCATVPVPRESVVESGKVPKGCRYVTGGNVLCTPRVAERVGVIQVERAGGSSAAKTARKTPPWKTASKKAPAKKTSAKKPAPKKASTTKASEGKGAEKRFCYTETSPYPFLKRRTKAGKKKLKKGCKKDPDTGKICCDRRQAPKRKKTVQGFDVDRFDFLELGDLGLGDLELHSRAPRFEATRGSRPSATARLRKSEMGKGRGSRESMGLALLDDSMELAADDEDDYALLDESDGLDLAPPATALPRRQQHLGTFGEFAGTWALGTVAAGAGLAITYELVDRMEYFDDAPIARELTFIGAGVIPAAAVWWLSQDAEDGDTYRSLAAAWGVAFTAVGALGLIRRLLERSASKSEDAEQRDSLNSAASHLPLFTPHEHEGDLFGGSGNTSTPTPTTSTPTPSTPTTGGEVTTTTGDDPATASPFLAAAPYPLSRIR